MARISDTLGKVCYRCKERSLDTNWKNGHNICTDCVPNAVPVKRGPNAKDAEYWEALTKIKESRYER